MITALPRLQQRQTHICNRSAVRICQSWLLKYACQPHGDGAILAQRTTISNLHIRRYRTALQRGKDSYITNSVTQYHDGSHCHLQVGGNTRTRSAPRAYISTGPRLPTRSRRKEITAWIELLDRFLPVRLRVNKALSVTAELDGVEFGHYGDEVSYKVRRIIQNAERHVEANIIAHMVLNDRVDAALHIIDSLLKNLAAHTSLDVDGQTPSNIVWPGTSLEELCSQPIQLDPATAPTKAASFDWDGQSVDPRYSIEAAGLGDNTMTIVLSLLGILTIRSSELDGDKAFQVMNTVLLIIGKIHNLNLVPENVYAYKVPFLNSTVQRPPILHLVSSRILTALSDAAWREQQKQMIAKAATHGVPYEEIRRDPPGGRFNLKVRPIEPEVWLEFLLWCCVEGGYTVAGVRIIKLLGEQSEKPWFAVTWSPNGSASQTAPNVDWDRVKLRHGGSVGLIEGYSRERPFVEMPQRTISTEVVLGLVEATIDSKSSIQSPEVTQSAITDLITFLEPHDLPIGYFNYLAVRYLQASALELGSKPEAFYNWFQKIAFLKSLTPARSRPMPQISYKLDSLSAHSDALAGILHQALNGFIQSGDIYQALEVFNDLQKLVDASKLQAIRAFISGGSDTLLTHSTTGEQSGYQYARQDFVGSHGQLSAIQLTGLLELATDAHLVGFGQWLLFNDDPDGSLISDSDFSSPSMARALFRFASLSKDRDLFRRILLAQELASRQSTVKVLRARANSFMTVLDFRKAKQPLLELAESRGGGYGLINLANLAATILRLEEGTIYDIPAKTGQLSMLNNAEVLLRQMLSGEFDATRAEFSTNVRMIFKQQVASLLDIFQFYFDSILWRLAERYKHKYRKGNDLSLSPHIFDIILGAVVEAKGPKEGMRLWNHFCGTPNMLRTPTSFLSDYDIDAGEQHNDDDEMLESKGQAIRSQNPLAPENSSLEFIPFVTEPEQAIPNQQSSESTVEYDNKVAPDFKGIEDDHSVLDTLSPPPPTSDITLTGPARISSTFMPDNADSVDLTTTSNEDDYNPVTIPTLRTLRTIVRQVVRDKQRSKIESNVYDEIVDWAKEQYALMGLDQRAIEGEIQARFSEEDVRNLHWRQLPSTFRRRRYPRRKPRDSVSGSRVRRLFSGNKQEHRSDGALVDRRSMERANASSQPEV